MASFLRKVLRNQSQSQSASRFFTQLSKSQTPPPLTPLLPPLFDSSRPFQNSIFRNTKEGDSSPKACSLFYPSFSFELFLNPTSHTGFIIPSEDDAGVTWREPPKIWADSVKKKRKRKMNKHKLKKLRKRLRRRT